MNKMDLAMERAMDMADTAMRGPDGRFLPGCSGNPAGKRPGTRNRASRLAGLLDAGEAERLARIVVEKALAGDAVSARFCLGYVLVKPRGEEIRLDLPERARPGDTVAAFNATLAALAAGEITPEEALTVARFLQGRREALQAWREERALTWEGDPIPGDQASREAAGLATVDPVALPEEEEDKEDELDCEEEDEDEDEEAAVEAYIMAQRRKMRRKKEAERQRRAAAVGWPPVPAPMPPASRAPAPPASAPPTSPSPGAACKSPAFAGDAGPDGGVAPAMRQIGARDTI